MKKNITLTLFALLVSFASFAVGHITGTTTACVGTTTTLADTTSGGSWSSGNTTVATVGITSGVVTGISSGTAIISYLKGTGLATITVTINPTPTISGPSTVCAGSTITLSDAITGGTWAVGSSAIATVSSGGIVTGVSAGVTNIYYSVGGCYAYHTVTVTGGASAISGASAVCAGSTITLSDATTGGSWISSNTAVATVGITSGVVTGISSGTATIYYAAGGCYAYHTVTVTGGASIYGPSTICAGSTITLSDATTGGTWAVGSSAIATVSSGGIVTGVSAGVTNIYYSVGGCFAYHTVTVTGGSSISGSSTVCAGSTITLSDATTGGTWTVGSSAIATVSSGGVVTGVSAGVTNIYYLVGGCYAYHTVTVTGGASISGSSTVCAGSTVTLSDVTTGGSWISSNTSVATVGLTSGVVTGVSAGTATIYYVVGGCYAYRTETVTGGSSTITGPSTVCVSSTITLSDATTGGSWISSNTAVATVGITSGVVTGVSAGTATIYYAAGGCYAYHIVTVTGGSSAISGPSTVCAGSTITISDAITGGTWTSSNTAVATVSSIGVVTGVSAGTCTIYYLVSGCYAYHTVTVTGGASIYGPSTVCAGSTITLSDATTGGTWAVGSSAIATVSSGGVVTGVSAGVTNIYYSVGGCFAYHTVTVTGGASIYGPSTVCVGSTITLSDATTGGTWITSSTSTATVSSGGIVTGVSAGVVNIYYSAGGCYAYHTVTVTGGASISGPSTVCAGSTITLSDVTIGGSWISSNTAVATVGITSGIVTGVSSGTATIYYAAGGCYAYHTVTVTGGSSTISGPSTVCAGSTITLSDTTSGGAWLSANSAIATVGSGGVVTGVSAGVVNIYYSSGGCYAYHTVTVTGGASISGPSTVCAGSSVTLSDITTGGSWISSNTAVATVGLTSGVVTGISAGTATIYYVVGGCGSYRTETVTGGASISGPSTVCVGSTITLSDATTGGTWTAGSSAIATVSSGGVVTGVSAGVTNIYYLVGGCYAYHTVTVTGGSSAISGPTTVCIGSTITLSDATTGGSWISSNTAVVTVGITSGVVTGVSAGTATIYYAEGGCYAYHIVTVLGGASISGPSTVCAGSTITLSDIITGGSWISSNTSVATVGITSGVVTGVSAGTATIYYSAGGCYAYHTVTVTGGVSISGPSTVCTGSTVTLSDAITGGTWISSNTSVATVSSGGIVTGVSAGTATIYYIAGGCYAYRTETVTGGASIYGPSTICAGSAVTLSDVITGGSWISSNTSVATVGITSGVVTGISAGTATIYYSVGGCYAYRTETVTGGASIYGASTVCAGSTITLSDATTGGTWTIGSSAIATVSSGGVVTGVSAGVTNIYYFVGGCYAYHTVTVTGGSSIAGPSIVCSGSTITLSDVTTGGSWISSNTAVATVGITSGVVTGVSAGTATIYYAAGGCYAYHTVTVTGGASIYGASTVCVGSSITLSDATPGGTWISSSTAVATVSSGVVTGVSAGVINIYYTVDGCYGYHTVTVTSAAISGPSTVCEGSTITLTDVTTGGTWSVGSSAVATVSSGGVVTGISAGVTNIYYSVGGCFGYHTVTVTAAPSAISGASSVDVGSTITLSDAVTGGTWISSNTALATVSSGGVVTGVATGSLYIYYVIGTCGVYYHITVAPAPGGLIGGSVVSGDGKGTSADIPVSGLLINLEDAANNVLAYTNTDNTGTYSFSGLADGNYVVAPQAAGYTTTSSSIITIGGTVENVAGINFKEYTTSKTIIPITTEGVKSLASANGISVFPNPTGGDLNIKWSNEETGTASVILTDVVGREVYKSVLNMNTASGQSQISLSELKNGIYLITIKSENIYYSGKLMIQK